MTGEQEKEREGSGKDAERRRKRVMGKVKARPGNEVKRQNRLTDMCVWLLPLRWSG